MTTETEARTGTIVRSIAEGCKVRAEGLRMKGVKRDDMTLNYFLGAAEVANQIGDMDLHEHIGRVAAWIIAIRGYAGLDVILKPEG